MLRHNRNRLLCVLSTGTLLLGTLVTMPSPAHAGTLLDEDFEAAPLGAPPPGWTVADDGGSVAVSNVPDGSDPDNRAMCVTRTTVNESVSAVRGFGPASGVVTVELRLRADQTDALFYGPILRDSAGTAAVQLALRENGQLGALRSSWSSFTAYSADTWYDLAVVADTDADTYDLYWNDSLLREDEPFRNPVGDLTDLRFSPYSWNQGTTTACYDNIAVGGGGGDSGLLDEDFEAAPLGAPPPGWTVADDGGSVAVSNVPDGADPDNRAMCVTRTTVNESVSAAHGFGPASGVVTVELRLRADQTDALFYGPALRDSQGNEAVLLALRENGQLGALRSSWSSFTAYSADTWYDLRVVADTDADTYDLYWNDSLLREDEPFRNAVGDLASVRFSPYSWNEGTTTACYDDIAVGGGDADPPPPGEWPGAVGKSGINANNENIHPDSVAAFCDWRGRDCEVTNTPTTRSTWDSMTGPGGGWLFDRFAGWPGQLVISQGLLPNSHQGQLTECANGDFDQHWRNFGTLLTNNDRQDSIVRLGWEFNGSWTNWAATDTQAWIGCYRTAAQNIRITAPEVTFDWTIGSHWSSSSICDGVSTNCYPGDDVVDIIGIDNYDMGPSAATLAEFNQIAEAQEGLTWLYDFAVSRGKPFSVGEWGIAPGSEFNDTGENPPFIQWMHDWFAERADNLAYEAYFNTCTPHDVQSNLHRPVSSEDNCVRLNSNAGSVYQSLFGG